MLCELARTDHHRFRVLEPDSDQTKALRALCRGREDLVQTRVALTNQLRAELERFWPGAVKIFRSLDSPIALAFLEKYPSPIEARALGEQRLAAFLARQHYSGRKTPAELLRKLRSAPEGRAGQVEIHTRRQLVLALVGLLGPLAAQIKQLGRSRAGRFQLRVGAGAQADVLGVRDGFAEQRADVVVVQRVDDVAPGASADHESEVAEYAQLLGHGGLFHLDRTG